MSKIFLLPDFVIDQIAAGEVLENPASAVKELIENSLDAGSTEIRIDIEGGGLQRICIEDDGSGMNREDAILCLRRHATSKIRLAQDLDTLNTMGFRGEALAALASVSKLELRTANGLETTRITSDGQIEPVARNRGTTIDARDLFYNAPARLKFQKSVGACSASVLKAVQAISLSNPNVTFRLFSNGKPTFQTLAKNWQERVEDVLGPFAHSIKPMEGLVSIKGLLGRPEEGKMNRSGQMVYVNRRPIQSPLISRAVKEGFGTRMQDGLYPVFCIFLEIPSDLVDVNVHPQKKEVRFRDEGRIYSMVRSAVISSFFEETFTPPPILPWEFTQVPTQSIEPLEFILNDSPIPLPLEVDARPKALLGDYLLAEKLGWHLIDLKGAESRILYESFESKKPSIQQLMWPFEIQVKNGAEEMAELVKQLYIDARPLGKHSMAIDAIPDGLEISQIPDLIQNFSEEKSERALAAALTRVCRSFKKNYSFDEACLILKRLHSCKDQNYDPLGRKIKVELNEKKLAEQFT